MTLNPFTLIFYRFTYYFCTVFSYFCFHMLLLFYTMFAQIYLHVHQFLCLPFFLAYQTFLRRNFPFYYSTCFRSSFRKDLLMAVRKPTQFSLLYREKPSSFFLLYLSFLLTQNTSLLIFLVTKCMEVPLTKQFSMAPAAI